LGVLLDVAEMFCSMVSSGSTQDIIRQQFFRESRCNGLADAEIGWQWSSFTDLLIAASDWEVNSARCLAVFLRHAVFIS
jgi:hypothetical protein